MVSTTVLAAIFAGLCALGCAACLYGCAQFGVAATRLRTLEHEIENLDAQLHKLRGKIYASTRETQTIEIAKAVSLETPCDNWLAAKNEGPSSKAAKCECAYCDAQRRARTAFRAQAVPKTASRR
jgi:outer membrane murein-binding lipoprotein Lpp